MISKRPIASVAMPEEGRFGLDWRDRMGLMSRLVEIKILVFQSKVGVEGNKKGSR